MRTIYLCENSKTVNQVYGKGYKVYCKNDVLSEPELFRNTEFIFSTWGMPVFSSEEIKSCFPNLKAVFYAAGTVKYFAEPFLKNGVKVFSAWAANAVPVAEYTVAQIVLANKGFFKTMRYTDNAKARETLSNYSGNYGVKVGIIGVGMIGKLVAERLKDYDIEVLAFDKFLSDEKAEEYGVRKVTLEELFGECQVVSNHLADNEQTKGMLGKELFVKMPQYATFINTGRGAQVIEKDLIEVLKKREDLTAILDVTYPEPPDKSSELYTLKNCILTPHIAGSTGNEVGRMAQYMKDEYENLVNTNPCKYEVTLQMLETMA